jgi:phage shock protein C
MAVPLQRSREHKMIAGVCGGIAEWLGWDPTLVRILYVVVSCVSVAFPGILAYVILWIIMPKAPVSELRGQDDRRL